MTKEPRESTGLPDPATWVDQHGDFLFRYALSRLRDAEVAEDLVQETFLAALRAKDKFAARSSERTWFVGILKHKIVDYLRRRGRERLASQDNSPGDLRDEPFDENGWWRVQPGPWSVSPGDALENREFWEAFRGCFEKLPQRLATVFSLREMDELATSEVCEALKVTPGNLGVLLYRARMQLRRCLEINWFNVETQEV